MHHVNQQMLSIELRRPHQARFKRRIQRMLQSPGLDAEARAGYKETLDHIGEPKVYNRNGLAPPGAIDPGPMPEGPPDIDFASATEDSLGKELHTNLIRHAILLEVDVPKTASKAQVIHLLLAHAQGENL